MKDNWHDDIEDSGFDFWNPKYFYRGMVLVSTFGADPKKTEAFSHTENFEDSDLLTARQKAIGWWRDTQRGIDREGKYMLPYAGACDWKLGEHAMALITVSLVESTGSEEWEYTIIGGDDIEEEEALEMESQLFGWDQNIAP